MAKSKVVVESPPPEPVGYLINRPKSTHKGKALLFVTRPSNAMFGSSNGTAIFAVDDVVPFPKLGMVVGKSAQGDIVFSIDMPYLVIPRALGTPVTTADLAKAQLLEKKEWEMVMEADEATQPDALSAVKVTEDGRTRHDSQGYL